MPKPKPDYLAVAAEFYDRVAKTADPIFIGIDPGMTGAMGFLSGKTKAVLDIPVDRVAVKKIKRLSDEVRTKSGKKTKTVAGTVGEFNHRVICDIFYLFTKLTPRVTVVLEKVPLKGKGPPRMGDIKLREAWAMWPLFLTSRKLRLLEPRPAEWQKVFGLKGSDKNGNRLKARKLFPSCTDISLVKHHNRAEALLLAEYGRRLTKKLPP